MGRADGLAPGLVPRRPVLARKSNAKPRSTIVRGEDYLIAFITSKNIALTQVHIHGRTVELQKSNS